MSKVPVKFQQPEIRNYTRDLFSGDSIAGIVVTNGSGGATSDISVSLNTTNPLRSPSNQRLSKSAVDAEGSEFEIKSFSMDEVDFKGTRKQILRFQYKTSENFLSGDLKLFLRNDSTGTYTSFQNGEDGEVLASTTPMGFVAWVYPNSDNADYTLVARVNSDNANAWDLDIIDLSLRPDSVVPGAIVTAPQACTPTFTGFGNVTTSNIKSWREGKFLHMSGTFVTGSTTGTEGRISLCYQGGNGNVTSASTLPTISQAGPAMLFNASNAAEYFPLIERSKNYITFGRQGSGGSAGLTKVNASTVASSGITISFNVRVEIEGWDAGAVFSTTEVEAKASGTLLASSASQTLSGSSQLKLTNLVASKDVLSIWNPSTDKGKIKSPGFYDVSLVVHALTTFWTANQQIQGYLYVNGSQVSPPLGRTRAQVDGTYSLESQGTFTFYFNAGDEIEFYVHNGNSNSITVDAWATIMARPDLTKFAQYGQGAVGDIKQSMLTEAQFISIHGPEWVLMDGRNVAGSLYEAITGSSTVPDARGLFLRGKNNGRADGNQNPDGDSALGTYQADALQGHWHQVTDDGGVAIKRPAGGTVGGLSDTPPAGNPASNPQGTNMAARTIITDGANGTPRVANETRPKNITVNFFIKIN